MAKKWEKFESESVEYLVREYGKYARFVPKGKSDSTKSDIEVQTNTGKSFYIEAKCCPAQCGQFVLLPNDETKVFDYSQLNVAALNGYSQQIIEHMNKNFELYKNAGTKGVKIEMEGAAHIFASWIKEYYKQKGVVYIITNNFEIFNIEDIDKVFEITAKYRVKRSGSRCVGKARVGKLKEYVEDKYNHAVSAVANGGKLIANSDKEMHNERFFFEEMEYMFSKRDQGYEVRRLSNTFNSNVIFSIKRSGLHQERLIEKEKFITILTQ